MTSSTTNERPLSPNDQQIPIDLEKGSPKTSIDDTALADQDADRDFITGKKLALVIIAVILSMFLVALDRTIIGTAVPRITDDFHSLDDVGWYASAYLITSCATQLSWGRFYTFYSSKYVYLTAIALFEIGSVVCGAAPNSIVFIVGRALAGLGCAGVFSGSTILVATVVPLEKRPAYVGMIGSVFGLSSIAGPLLGGAFTDHATWRWCFYINLPIGAVTVIILVFILQLSPVEAVPLRKQIAQLDPFGTLVLLPCLVCFLLALQWGGSAYPWGDARIIALFVLSGALFMTFIGIQIWQQENATVPPRIFRQRSMFCVVAYVICIGGAMITIIYYLPLWFQAIKGVSAVHSGINSLPMVLSLVVASIVSGAAITKTGYYNPWMFACSIIMSIGIGLMSTFQADTDSSKWIGYQVLFGLGLGLGMQQGGTAAQAVLSPKDISTGVSLMFFGMSLGGAIFVCIAEAVFANDLVESLSKISGLQSSLIINAGATQLRDLVDAQDLPLVLSGYNAAIQKAFTVALAAACFSILPACGIEWKNVKGLKHGGPSPARNATEEK